MSYLTDQKEKYGVGLQGNETPSQYVDRRKKEIVSSGGSLQVPAGSDFVDELYGSDIYNK